MPVFSPAEVRVSAPSRLHFGLFALQSPTGSSQRSYGGVGVMVSQPGMVVRVRPAQGHSVAGPLAERAADFAVRWSQFYGRSLDQVSIEVVESPPDHVGLGTGTQLGLAISAALSAWYDGHVPQPDELARSVGRGLRSAVGAYGFSLGGLIVDRGKLPGEFLSPLDCRLTLPDDWRFVLVRPSQGSGLAGETEQRAIDRSNQQLEAITEKLVAEARESLLPAAALGRFEPFAASLGRYCELAGQFYLKVQGGPYNGPAVTALAERIRSLGHVGLGQSSWGPTLFVACRNQASAKELVQQLSTGDSPPLQVTISPVCNQPAQVEIRREPLS
jgi:beta-ribofuranosylaminobenzene 5'-phosphate synthase